jgi:hypothetical protein
MFENCNIAKETRNELIKIVGSVELKQVQRSIAKEFYNVDDVVEFLYNTVTAGGNGILHGPGGFGKSEITKAFFKFYGISPLVIVGHSGTDIESLLGIPNIKKLTEESIHEIAFEKSVFSKPGILIFEEFLDVKPSVASALKDIITEGGYRRGDEFIPSRVGTMLICSNKSPEEVVIDFSTAAFYKERFPYSKYVIWENYSSNSYFNLFKLVYADKVKEDENAFRLIAELCSSSCNPTTIISPRMAFSAINVFMRNKDVRVLSMISSIDTTKLSEIQTRLRLEQQYEHLNGRFQSVIKTIAALDFDYSDKAIAFISFANEVKKEAGYYNVEGDALIKTVSTFIDTMALKLEEAKEKLLSWSNYTHIAPIIKDYEDIQKYLPR